jgi:hypothetical protein
MRPHPVFRRETFLPEGTSVRRGQRCIEHRQLAGQVKFLNRRNWISRMFGVLHAGKTMLPTGSDQAVAL